MGVLSGGKGRAFESRRVHHLQIQKNLPFSFKDQFQNSTLLFIGALGRFERDRSTKMSGTFWNVARDGP